MWSNDDLFTDKWYEERKPKYKRYSDYPQLDEKEFDIKIGLAIEVGDGGSLKEHVKALEARLEEKGCNLDSVNGLDNLEVDSPLRRWAKILVGLDKSQRKDGQVLFEVLNVQRLQNYLDDAKELAQKHYQSSTNKDIFDDLKILQGFKDYSR